MMKNRLLKANILAYALSVPMSYFAFFYSTSALSEYCLERTNLWCSIELQRSIILVIIILILIVPPSSIHLRLLLGKTVRWKTAISVISISVLGAMIYAPFGLTLMFIDVYDTLSGQWDPLSRLIMTLVVGGGVGSISMIPSYIIFRNVREQK